MKFSKNVKNKIRGFIVDSYNDLPSIAKSIELIFKVELSTEDLIKHLDKNKKFYESAYKTLDRLLEENFKRSLNKLIRNQNVKAMKLYYKIKENENSNNKDEVLIKLPDDLN